MACLQKGGRGELLHVPRAHFVHTIPILSSLGHARFIYFPRAFLYDSALLLLAATVRARRCYDDLLVDGAAVQQGLLHRQTRVTPIEDISSGNRAF